MSYPAIAKYREELRNLEQFATKLTESNLRPLFLHLLNDKEYARGADLRVVDEETLDRSQKRPDGALLNSLGLSIGYWESKGPNVNFAQAISKKLEDGYPIYNTLFENSQEIILYQDRVVRAQVSFDNDEALDECLQLFVSYRPKEVTRFEQAIERFKSDLPSLLKALREKIDTERNADFIKWRDTLIEHCKIYINPSIEQKDIREMLIQHILTADIFERIFTDADFHREHHLASEMNRLQKALLGGQPRKEYLSNINYYYEALGAAAGYVSAHEKQNFLKTIYEEFYKAYNPKAADRLGIVYTPTEIVKFIVRNADELLKKHFGKGISDEYVNILDPATGTGTFVSELIDYMDETQLSYKYKYELHANEVSLLAYYIANLNIEYAYKQKAGAYTAFDGLCFVDTLDLDVSYKGKQGDLLAGISDENIRRVEAQQEKTIHLIIGNPPYNTGQNDENENNKNRKYPEVDRRIKDTFVKLGTARNKRGLYDMYLRFYRWAMDRLKDEGMVAFITNRSFIDAFICDGFRRIVQQDFDYAYVVDLGGDVRAKGREAGGNVFGIMAGVAIMFLIKKKDGARNCRIHYFAYPSTDNKEEKLRKLSKDSLDKLEIELIEPDKDARWIDLSTSDFDKLPIPVCNEESKLAKQSEYEKALFKLYSCGVKTNKDNWIYARSKKDLTKKVAFFIEKYNAVVDKIYPTDKDYNGILNDLDYTIEWSETLRRDVVRGTKYTFKKELIRPSMYRPFISRYVYFERALVERRYQMPSIFGENGQKKNICICFSDTSNAKPFHVLATTFLPDLSLITVRGQCLPLYRYNSDEERIDNITKWGVAQFQAHYKRNITRTQIFAYTYAVLHAPSYREKYTIDLKRHYPRLPFYEAFSKLSELGQKLLDLHTNYEKASPYGLKRVEKELSQPLPRLRRSRAEPNCIEIDTATTLHGVPDEAWAYKLGTRSALEWVLDQYKEKKDDLPPIEGLRAYSFSNYKEEAIELLDKVCTVSQETVQTVGEIDKLTQDE